MASRSQETHVRKTSISASLYCNKKAKVLPLWWPTCSRLRVCLHIIQATGLFLLISQKESQIVS